MKTCNEHIRHKRAFNLIETFVERFGIDFRKFQEMLVYYVLVEAAAIRFLIGEASVVKGRSQDG